MQYTLQSACTYRTCLAVLFVKKMDYVCCAKKGEKRGRESDGEREKSLNRIYSNGFKLSKFAIIEREV